jgi:hypothetical protein
MCPQCICGFGTLCTTTLQISVIVARWGATMFLPSYNEKQWDGTNLVWKSCGSAVQLECSLEFIGSLVGLGSWAIHQAVLCRVRMTVQPPRKIPVAEAHQWGVFPWGSWRVEHTTVKDKIYTEWKLDDVQSRRRRVRASLVFWYPSWGQQHVRKVGHTGAVGMTVFVGVLGWTTCRRGQCDMMPQNKNIWVKEAYGGIHCYAEQLACLLSHECAHNMKGTVGCTFF